MKLMKSSLLGGGRLAFRLAAIAFLALAAHLPEARRDLTVGGVGLALNF